MALGKAASVDDALFAHIVVVGGQVVGGWKRTVEKGAVAIQLRLLTRLTPKERRAVVVDLADVAGVLEEDDGQLAEQVEPRLVHRREHRPGLHHG